MATEDKDRHPDRAGLRDGRHPTEPGSGERRHESRLEAQEGRSWLEELFGEPEPVLTPGSDTEPEPDSDEPSLSRKFRGEVREGYGKTDSGAEYVRRLFG